VNAMAQPCVLCGGFTRRVLFEAFGYPVVQCGTCALVSTARTARVRDAANFYCDQYFSAAPAYAASLLDKAGVGDGDDRIRVRVAARLAHRRAGTVLDIGCASGSLLAAFRKAGWSCRGIEPCREMAAAARRTAGCEVVEGTLETSALPASSCDVVTALHVLEHSPEPRRFLECCRRVLRAEGVLLLEVPDFGSRCAETQRESWRPLYPDTHCYHFTRATLTRLLESCGFSVVRVRRFGGGGETPASDSGRAGVASISRRIFGWLFERRHVLYGVPLLKRSLRFVYWQLFRMNDCLQVYARAVGSRQQRVANRIGVFSDDAFTSDYPLPNADF
jgi:SAM-dependent methyltransferase